MPHTEIEVISFRLGSAKCMETTLWLLYRDLPIPASPMSLKIKEKKERNVAIRQRFAEGETLTELAAAFGISQQRVHQIIYGYS